MAADNLEKLFDIQPAEISKPTEELFADYQAGRHYIVNKGYTKNEDGSRSIPIRISLDGSVHRIKTARSIKEVREDHWFLDEFERLFKLAKKAYLEGDLENVGRFFTLLDVEDEG